MAPKPPPCPPGGVTWMAWRFWPTKAKSRPWGCSFPGAADVPGGSSTGGLLPGWSAQLLEGVPVRLPRQSMPLGGPRNPKETQAFFCEPQASTEHSWSWPPALPAANDLARTFIRLGSSSRWTAACEGISSSAPPSRTSPEAPGATSIGRLLRALLPRACCQPALVACSRCAAVTCSARRLAVGTACFLPHLLQMPARLPRFLYAN